MLSCPASSMTGLGIFADSCAEMSGTSQSSDDDVEHKLLVSVGSSPAHGRDSLG